MLRLEVLSGFRLFDLSGKGILVPALETRALMAYLCMSPDRLHRRERLACLLWDGAGDRSARQSLRSPPRGRDTKGWRDGRCRRSSGAIPG